MKKIYGLGLIAFALLLTTTMLFSQDSSTVEPEDGEKTQSIGLYPFNYIGFAYEKKIDADRSWRFYVDLDGSIFNNDTETKKLDQVPGDTANTRSEDLFGHKDFGVELAGLHVWRVYVRNKFHLVTGIGPLLAINWYSDSSDRKNYDRDGLLDYTYKYNSHTFSYGLGVLALFGAGYDFTEEFTLYGEYRVKYVYNWQNGSNKSTSYYPNTGNEFKYDYDISGSRDEFSLSNVLVGVYYSF